MLIIDITELEEVQKQLNRLPHKIFRTEVAAKAMLNAVQPTLIALKNSTPVGSKVYVPKSGKNAGDITYARGGYLKASARKKNTAFPKFGEVQAIVGYSKKGTKAGWRAHFTDKGFTHWKSKRYVRGKNWIKPTENLTAPLVAERFVTEIQREVDKILGPL